MAIRGESAEQKRFELAGVRPAEAPRTNTEVLRDRFGRTYDYLRIAVTDRCNLRCVYCMPEAGIEFASRETILRTEEVLRVIRIASGLGVSKIRYTGGEPLLRGDIVKLVAAAAETPGIEAVSLTTNGVLLPRLAQPLRAAGLHGVNISLDTLRAERFRNCTRRSGLAKVLDGLGLALRLAFPAVKVNVVAMRGFNDDEIAGFASLTRRAAVTVRFIELMPFDSHQIWRTGQFLSTSKLVSRFRQLYRLSEVTEGSSTEEQVFRIPGYVGKVAFIPSYTRTLCTECTRVRLTADGRIRNCLYSEDEYDILGLLRNGGSDGDIAGVLNEAMWEKLEDGRAAQRRASRKRGSAGKCRESMTQIGG